METLQISDKRFVPAIGQERIGRAVAELATRLNRELPGKGLVFVVVLNGAFMFASDLLKQIDRQALVSFVKLSSYSGTASTGKVNELIGINEELRGRTVVVIEDIIESGATLDRIVGLLKAHGPASVRIVTLFMKKGLHRGRNKPDYVGMNVPDEFIIGYGLDYNGFGRNFPFVCRLSGF